MGALDDKVALVTGAASGIGRATAELFAGEGARVCVVDVDGESGPGVAQSIGGRFVHADVGDSSRVDAAFAECEHELGGLDIAFLNAGIALGAGDVATLTDADYRRIMRVNIDGVVFGTRAAVRIMDRRGGGAIVATSSLAGLVPFPPDPIYTATKHAVVGFIRSVAPTLAPRDITANAVNPGLTDTNLLAHGVKGLFQWASLPLLQAGDVADAVLALVTSGRTGECWVCRPGREPAPHEFRDLPEPGAEGARGQLAPDVSP